MSKAGNESVYLKARSTKTLPYYTLLQEIEKDLTYFRQKKTLHQKTSSQS